jgi:hypothetical protein
VAAPAADLYTSPLFLGRRRFVERSCDRWFILSALHGLLRPDEVIEPYDVSLVSARAPERRAWARQVLKALDAELGDLAGTTFEVHAGAAYRDFGLVEGLRRRSAEVVVPAEGLSQGRQLAFYAGTPEPGVEPTSLPRSPRPPAPPGAGYAPLGEWLSAFDGRQVSTTFVELERLLARPLPASARTHRAWWANNDRSPQARAWLGAGWRVAVVDRDAGRVTFTRSS